MFSMAPALGIGKTSCLQIIDYDFHLLLNFRNSLEFDRWSYCESSPAHYIVDSGNWSSLVVLDSSEPM